MPLDDALKKLDKKFGEGTVRPFSEIEYPDVECTSSGSLLLDIAIGGGKKFLGIPEGRVTLLWGPKGTAKSTLCSHIIAEVQKIGKVAALADMEFSFEPEYAQMCGVDVDKLIYIRPYSVIPTKDYEEGEMFGAEDIFEMSEILIRSKEISLLIWDSVDQLSPRRELDGEYGESHMGLKALLNAQAMRKLLGALRMNDVSLVGTTQRRYKLGRVFGSPETMSGGQALAHSASVRVNMKLGELIKDRGEPIGRNIRCQISWSKIAPPLRTAEIPLHFGQGFVKEDELITLGVEHEIMEKRGSYFYFSEDEYVQGRINAIQFLREHPEIAESLEAQIKEKYQNHKEEVK